MKSFDEWIDNINKSEKSLDDYDIIIECKGCNRTMDFLELAADWGIDELEELYQELEDNNFTAYMGCSEHCIP